MENNKLAIKKQHIWDMQRPTNEMNFQDCLKSGLVEFLDVEEEETAMIAMHISQINEQNSLQNTNSSSS